MANKFFDENVLKEISNNYPILENYDGLTFHFNEIDGVSYFFCQIGDERLNGFELKGLLKINEVKSFLSENEVSLLNYLTHRLIETQSYYKISNDFNLLFSNLINSKFDCFWHGNKISFSKLEFKLNLNIVFDENNDVLLDLKDDGEFIFGMDKVFFKKNDIIYPLNENIPLNFYKELFLGKNAFSIDAFFKLEKTYLEKLKSVHNIAISKDVSDLSNLDIAERVAPLVLNVDKTQHFIAVDLRYKVGEETFNVTDYVYADTINWVDKRDLIKIVKEGGKLVKYVSDKDLSEDLLDDIFEGSRIMYRRHMKEPFKIMLPIFQLNNFVTKVIPQAEKFVEVDYRGGQKIEVVDGNVGFDIETMLNTRLNLFEFKVRFKIDEEYFDLDFVKELMQKSRKYVQLKNGKTVNIENIREINKWIEFLRRFDFSRSKNLYKSSSYTALELDKFLDDFENKSIRSNDEYRNLILELKEKNLVEGIDLPSQVSKILRDYQKDGVYWLYFLRKYGFGGILADEMGLGKTLQALTALSMVKGKTSIVICPKTLIYNWENEVNKYFPDMKVVVVDGDGTKRKRLIKKYVGRCDVLITSYSMLQKDYELYVNRDYTFGYSVLDEAHYVKNIKTLSAKAVRLIKSEHRLLLTGTPLENNLDELYGAFDLIMPGFLGHKSDFSKEFVSKIERNNMIALEILQAKIKPFILRRTKKEVLKELPEKQEQIVYSEMTNKQVGIYNEVLRRVRAEVNELVREKGFDRSRIQILSALLKLRQICNHPVLLDSTFKGDEDISGKYNQFLELLTEVVDNEKKVLIFSQFTSMLDIMSEDLERMKIKYLRLDGSTKNRQELVDKFNEDEGIKVFLISLKAGGVGLNLTAASAVFLYDPWWNPMVEQQAQDRAHRIGQKNTVHVYKFISKNSIEEKILKLQERKGSLFDNLITENQGFIKRLEWEDLMELFD